MIPIFLFLWGVEKLLFKKWKLSFSLSRRRKKMKKLNVFLVVMLLTNHMNALRKK